MCNGIALDETSVTEELEYAHIAAFRKVLRGNSARVEYHFLFEHTPRELPVWYQGRLQIIPWGHNSRTRNNIPNYGICKKESLNAGSWNHLHPQPVKIPAVFVLDRGVWYHCSEGIQGILIYDREKQPVVYVLTQPASHYYTVMTRNERMPVFFGESI